jgi:hypothetical protein
MSADEAYQARIEKDLEQLRIELEPLEAGTVFVFERQQSGDESWRDVTQERITQLRRIMRTYEAILAHL